MKHEDYIAIHRFSEDIEEVINFTKYSMIKRDGARVLDKAFDKFM